MQNNNKPKGFRRFLRENGYYLVIGACLLAIGVSGFYLARSNSLSDTAETMSVPVRIETEEKTDAAKPADDTAHAKDTKDSEKQPSATVDEPDVGTSADQPAESVSEAAEIQAEESVVTSRTVVMPVTGEILNGHSVQALAYHETMRDWRTHNGIDLAAAVGTPVSAAEAGTVSAVYSDDYLGTTVEITHDSGYRTTYANLEETPSVRVGQTVAAGDPIGTVGSSTLLEVGEAPHLHFSVSKDGECVDPGSYLPN